MCTPIVGAVFIAASIFAWLLFSFLSVTSSSPSHSSSSPSRPSVALSSSDPPLEPLYPSSSLLSLSELLSRFVSPSYILRIWSWRFCFIAISSPLPLYFLPLLGALKSPWPYSFSSRIIEHYVWLEFRISFKGVRVGAGARRQGRLSTTLFATEQEHTRRRNSESFLW